MEVRLLTSKEIPKLEKVKDKYDIFSVVNIKTPNRLDVVEFFNKDGVFRGFGKNKLKAFKKALSVAKKYYK